MNTRLRDLRYQNLAISPEKMLQNLKKDLEINVSVGIWYFTPGGGRFHDRFVEEATIPDRIDINPENMPIQKAVELNIMALDRMKERISRLPHEEIIECHLHPESHRGELEGILINNW
jgi:hypothetical protein